MRESDLEQAGHGRDRDKQMDMVSFASGWLAGDLQEKLNALPDILPIRNVLGLQASFIKCKYI